MTLGDPRPRNWPVPSKTGPWASEGNNEKLPSTGSPEGVTSCRVEVEVAFDALSVVPLSFCFLSVLVFLGSVPALYDF